MTSNGEKCISTSQVAISKKQSASPHVQTYLFQIFVDVSNAVYEDDCDRLKELGKLIDNINPVDSKSLCALYADNDNPLLNTNIVILASKLTRIDIIEYIFSSEDRILNTFSTKIGGSCIHPEYEDEENHNAFYYAIRNGNVHLLKTLICKWPVSNFTDRFQELDILLSKTYEELNLKNIEVTQEMKIFVESTLLYIRLHSINCSLPSGTDVFLSTSAITERIDMIIENIKFLVFTYFDKEVDEVCLLTLRFIANNIHLLKGELKSTCTCLPWEEIVFLLVIFIHDKKQPKDSILMYCSMLTKHKIFNYLQDFSNCLSKEKYYVENMKKSTFTCISECQHDNTGTDTEQNNILSGLYCDYSFVRNAFSLEIMQNYLETIVSLDHESEDILILVTRCLQVMKKFIIECPKFSNITCEVLLLSLSDKTKKVLFCKCDPKFYICSLSKSNKGVTSSGIFKDLLKDINKLNKIVTDLLNTTKIKTLIMLIEQIANGTNLDEVMECVKIVDTIRIKGTVLSKLDEELYKLVEKFIKKLNTLVTDKTMYEKQLLCDIHEIIDCSKSKLTSSETNNDTCLSLLKYLKFNIRGKKMTQTDFFNIKRLANQILMYLSPSMKCECIKKIAELMVEIWDSIVPRKQTKLEEMYKIILQVLKIAEFQLEKQSWVNELWNNVNKTYFFYESDKKKNHTDTLQCTHVELPCKLGSNLQDVISGSAQNFFGSSNDCFLNIEISSQLFDEFLCFINNRNMQVIVEALLLDELSTSNYSNFCMSDNRLLLEESRPILYGKRMHEFLTNGYVLIDAQLFDPLIATFTHAILLCCNVFPHEKIKHTKTIQNAPLQLKVNHDANVDMVANQENMFIALKEGKLEVVKKCIQNGADINGRNFNMWTALHFAAQGPSVEVVKFLIDQNLRINAKDVNGKNPLHVAAMYGRKNIVEFFINETNMCINASDDTGKTPLLFAIQNGFKDIVNLLLSFKNNASISRSACLDTGEMYCGNVGSYFSQKETTPDYDTVINFTLLHAAAGSDCEELIDHLLQNEENVNTKNNIQETPLHIAAENGYLLVVKNLILKGASVNVQNRDGCIPLHKAVENDHKQVVRLLLEVGSNVNVAEKTRNYTPLSYAAQGGFKDIAQLLLENGANANAVSLEGMSPLHIAVIKEHKDVALLLIKNGASVNAATKNGCTALHLSAMKDNIEILCLLKKNGGNINAQNKKNQTLLHIASEYDCRYIPKILIAENIGINSKDMFGFTALHVCCRNGHVNMVSFLLEEGASINTQDKNKRTPLHIAALYNTCNVIDILVRKGANVNQRDGSGFTALHLAALKGNIEVVKKLISENANVNLCDVNGVSPLHVAVQANHKEIIEILIEKGSKINAEILVGCSLLHDANTNWERKLLDEVLELAMGHVPMMKNVVLQRYEKAMTKRVYTPLFFAVYNNNADIVCLLISKGAKVCVEDGVCARTSVYFGYKRILGILLENKRVDVPGCAHLLYFAALKGHLQIVKMLLSKGAHVNAAHPGFSFTPLCAAAERGHLEIVKLLIANNAKFSSSMMMGDYGTTPLHRAAMLGHKKVVEVLLQSNAVPPHMRDLDFTTPLEQAVAGGHKEIAEMLLKYREVNINAKGKDDFTVLHIAAQEGKLEMSKMLVERGADMKVSNNKGAKPIHVAAREGHVSIVEFFLTIGVDVNILGSNKQTCLHYAIFGGQTRVVNFLLQKNIDINASDSNGMPALHFAAFLCHKDIVNILLKNGAYCNIMDIANRMKPLDMAANEDIKELLANTEMLFNAVKCDNSSLLETCIQNGGVTNAKNKDNSSPLIYASWKGSNRIVDVLLRNNADPNSCGKGGCSPLHYASKYSHLKVVLTLLSHGAIYNIKNTKEKTPLSLAENSNIINLLTLVDKLFTYAQNGDINLLVELKSIKDADTLRAIAKTCNRKKETIIVHADHNGYPFLEEVKKILNTVFAPVDLANAFFAQKQYEEGMNVLFKR